MVGTLGAVTLDAAVLAGVSGTILAAVVSAEGVLAPEISDEAALAAAIPGGVLAALPDSGAQVLAALRDLAVRASAVLDLVALRGLVAVLAVEGSGVVSGHRDRGDLAAALGTAAVASVR